MKKYLYLIVLVPVAIVLIAFSVANRHFVKLSLDPLNAADPAISVQLPLFAIVFAAMAAGLICGGIGTWFTQGKHRKLARKRRQEAAKWRFEAEKLDAENAQPQTTGKGKFPILPPSKAA